MTEQEQQELVKTIADTVLEQIKQEQADAMPEDTKKQPGMVSHAANAILSFVPGGVAAKGLASWACKNKYKLAIMGAVGATVVATGIGIAGTTTLIPMLAGVIADAISTVGSATADVVNAASKAAVDAVAEVGAAAAGAAAEVASAAASGAVEAASDAVGTVVSDVAAVTPAAVEGTMAAGSALISNPLDPRAAGAAGGAAALTTFLAPAMRLANDMITGQDIGR